MSAPPGVFDGETQPFGVVGLGLLGIALAKRWIASGLAVAGTDLNPERGPALEQAGGRVLPGAEAIARTCPVVFVCVRDDPQLDTLEPAWTTPGSVVRIVVQCTTGDPERASDRSKRLRRAGIRHVDAAVAGSSAQVQDGTARALVGGEPDGWDWLLPILSRILASVAVCGGPGDGLRAKLVFNHCLGLQRAILAETLSLAKALGPEPGKALALLDGSAADMAVLRSKGSRMVERRFDPVARLDQHAKDVRLIRRAAERAGVRLPFQDQHAAILDDLLAAGCADHDNASVIRWWDTPEDANSAPLDTSDCGRGSRFARDSIETGQGVDGMNRSVRFYLLAQIGVDVPEGSGLVVQRKDGSTVVWDCGGVELEIECRADGDIAGEWVSGPKGARFVYFGLPIDGGWSRRWKWRQEQIVQASKSAGADSHTVSIRFLLGKSVTPDVLSVD